MHGCCHRLSWKVLDCGEICAMSCQVEADRRKEGKEKKECNTQLKQYYCKKEKNIHSGYQCRYQCKDHVIRYHVDICTSFTLQKGIRAQNLRPTEFHHLWTLTSPTVLQPSALVVHPTFTYIYYQHPMGLFRLTRNKCIVYHLGDNWLHMAVGRSHGHESSLSSLRSRLSLEEF